MVYLILQTPLLFCTDWTKDWITEKHYMFILFVYFIFLYVLLSYMHTFFTCFGCTSLFHNKLHVWGTSVPLFKYTEHQKCGNILKHFYMYSQHTQKRTIPEIKSILSVKGNATYFVLLNFYQNTRILWWSNIYEQFIVCKGYMKHSMRYNLHVLIYYSLCNICYNLLIKRFNCISVLTVKLNDERLSIVGTNVSYAINSLNLISVWISPFET